MKKFFANLIFIAIIAAAVFFIGWVQFFVKPGFCGVLSSKTSGLYPEAIENGSFTWRWERLLPTNTTLKTFSLGSKSFSKSVTGALPSAQIYSRQFDPNPDFSYQLTALVTLSVEAKQIVNLVKNKEIETSEDLDAWLEKKAMLVTQKTADFLISNESAKSFTNPVSLSETELAKLKELNASDFSGFNLLSVSISSAKIPDLKIYKMAEESFSLYRKQVDDQLKILAKNQAQTLANENRSMQQLEKFANLIAKYPQLEELSKSDNFTDIINALNNAR